MVMMQWPRVDCGLNCVGAMAFRAFAAMKAFRRSPQLFSTVLWHHWMSMKPSWSLRMPSL